MARNTPETRPEVGGDCSCEQQKYFYVAHVDFGMVIGDFKDEVRGEVVEFAPANGLDAAARVAGLRLDLEGGFEPKDLTVAAMKPLLIRRVPSGVEAAKCMVLFADGHIEYFDYPEDYPCTPEAMRALREFEAGRCREGRM